MDRMDKRIKNRVEAFRLGMDYLANHASTKAKPARRKEKVEVFPRDPSLTEDEQAARVGRWLGFTD